VTEYPHVVIIWTDAFQVTTGWTEIDALELEHRIVESAGWLIHADHHGLAVIALSLDDTRVDNVVAIPTSAVKAIVNLDRPAGRVA